MGLDLHESGAPAVNEETCAGCGQCVRICVAEYLEMHDGKPRVGDGTFMGCTACGHCVAICPTGSISVTGRGLQPADRLELPPDGQRANVDQLEALLLARRSVRKFQEKEVDRELLDRIIEVTALAPMGLPPHEVGTVVFHGRDKVRAFAEDVTASFGRMGRFFNPVILTLMRPILGKAQHAVLRDFVRPLFQSICEGRGQGIDRFTYDAPAAMLFHHTPQADPADCPIAATYAMLAAESLGLGSCLLGTTVALSHDRAIKKKYGIPSENKVGLTLVLGHPAVKFRGAIKRQLASMEYA